MERTFMGYDICIIIREYSRNNSVMLDLSQPNLTSTSTSTQAQLKSWARHRNHQRTKQFVILKFCPPTQPTTHQVKGRKFYCNTNLLHYRIHDQQTCLSFINHRILRLESKYVYSKFTLRQSYCTMKQLIE